jgi:hypothetical protein
MKSPDLGNRFLEASKTKHDSNLFWLFPVLPLAKFGSFILWMIASPPTSQNWKKSPWHNGTSALYLFWRVKTRKMFF